MNVPITSIAVSTGQNDSGVFELNFRDERYIPFEGAGAISKWRIELPGTFREFDYDIDYRCRHAFAVYGYRRWRQTQDGCRGLCGKLHQEC